MSPDFRVIARAQDGVDRVGQHLDAGHQRAMLIGARVGITHEGRRDAIAESNT